MSEAPVVELMRGGTLAAGKALGSYEVEAVLGRGWFGVVYLARHRELRHLAAIKEYLPAKMASRVGVEVQVKGDEWRDGFEDGLHRFLQEARKLVELWDVPAAVDCWDVFRANGTAYMVMEYEKGLPLSELLVSQEVAGSPFTESDLLGVARPLVDGLAKVHEAGLVHTNIQPSNILVRRPDGQPVLIGFGWSRQAMALHEKSVTLYTAGYAAPEQVGEGKREGETAGPWTDVYAVGAVMWRMVAGGRRPWEPPNPVKAESRLLGMVGRGDPLPTARSLGEGRFSAGLLDTIDRCLALRVPDRVQDCGELLQLLGSKWESTAQPAVGEILGVHETQVRQGKRPADSGTESGRRLEERMWPLRRRVTVWAGAALGMVSVGAGYLVLQDVADPFAVPVRTAFDGPAPAVVYPLEPAEVPRTWPPTNALEFVDVPAGEFVMGSDSQEAISNERPLTRVRINEPFQLGKYEVTQGQWLAMMGSNPSRFFTCGPDCPVEDVQLSSVQSFIGRLNWLGDGWKYRLPTEAEWEYAARAGVSGDEGERYGSPDEVAWYQGNSGGGTHPVGQKAANAWGLHDMLGNVGELTMDERFDFGRLPGGAVTGPGVWAQWNPFSSILPVRPDPARSHSADPLDGMLHPRGAASYGGRILRGCSWFHRASLCRSSYRDITEFESRSAGGSQIGFRLYRIR